MFPPKPPQGADPRMYFFLFLLTLGTTLGYQGWTLLDTNFAVESAHLSAADNGLVQSLREVPGLLGFLIIPLLLVMKEHRVAAVAALATGLGTALTGFFPSFVPVILTTLLMSFGFHFFEAVNQSLLLQYFDVRTTPVVKKMVFRRNYWLFYLLTLFLGARRQIFIVFALFLLVEHFRFSVNTVSVLFMINYAINWFLNPLIGRTINRIGERKLLSIEYSTAILVFTGYATTGSAWVAGVLYVIDYIVFNFSIALRTFFQKIAEPQDIAPTMAVAQTINHVAAIFVPALGGWLWVEFGYQIPFFIGAALSGCSLLLVQIIDREIRLHAPAKA